MIYPGKLNNRIITNFNDEAEKLKGFLNKEELSKFEGMDGKAEV